MGLKGRRVVSSVAVLTGLLVVGLLLLMPISGNFAGYLWWRYTADPHPQTGSIYTDGAAIHYQRYPGQGPAILLLHGGLSHRLSWFSQLPWLVSSGREVVLIDSRGHGRSDLGDGELSYERHAADVMAVMAALHLRKADIIGWSDGGNTALVLAHLHPERINRVLAISANYDPSGLTAEARADAGRPANAFTYWINRWWTEAGPKTQALEGRIKRMWLSGPNLTPTDLTGIRCPVLLIVGGRDVIRLEHAEAMAGLIPGARLEVVVDGGHSLPVTEAGWVNREIGGFLHVPLP
ncbi:alpha/beta hydrolase [Thiorhodococcus mannitoliphagus]|uniref:Alpha/beta hydrolase n=1 Tax=Thiorhodococcus mannitoliphagus TaxID=329406 RepID=A0A6P1E375_9GAMM|nr:alpha/beta hydrolase [Thiorhodococcus mannitoliphagus]NEX22942.1 alpha/beta hydrolase [Thiorhodococcus mannitoliphagus]